jgi:DNA-binding PadR family transcriptional regulator
MDAMERLVKAGLIRAERVKDKDDLRGIFVKDLTDEGRSYLERWRRENAAT